MSNINHPKIGDSIRVEPLRDVRDIKKIKGLLSDKPRDYCLFVTGINTALRGSDLLKINVGMVRNLSIGEHFYITEKKTKKKRCISLNRAVHEAIKNLLVTMPNAEDHEPLFQSRKGKQQLTVPYLNNLVKAWCSHFNLRGNFGSHTLRKTWGYQQRVQFNESVPVLMQMFNHSTQRMTMQYLGIQEEEVQNAYLREI